MQASLLLKRVLPLSLFLLALDQASKWVVTRMFGLYEGVDVIPGFFSLLHVINKGASWGLLDGWAYSKYLLSVIAVLALAALIVFRKAVFLPTQPWPAFTLALLLGGIGGNLVDRVRIGGVTDFFHLYRGAYHFPIFNIADVCISGGLVLYIIGQVVAERRAKRTACDDSAA